MSGYPVSASQVGALHAPVGVYLLRPAAVQFGDAGDQFVAYRPLQVRTGPGMHLQGSR